jgi:hypothetical protein
MSNPRARDADDAATEQPCCLLALPAELRLQIYEFLLSSMACTPVYEELKHCTALLDTCHQVYSEAGQVFIRHRAELYHMRRECRRRIRETVLAAEFWNHFTYSGTRP